MDSKASPRMNLAMILAATMGALGNVPAFQQRREPKQRKPVPMMVTSPAEVIAAWNAAIEAKKPPKPSKHHRNFRGDSGQHPKFIKVRTHRPASHPQRDEHGGYTLVGRPYAIEGIHPTSREVVLTGWVDGEQFGYTVQRKWLGGISSQRGF